MNLMLEVTTASCSLLCSSTALIAARLSAASADLLPTTCHCDIDGLLSAGAASLECCRPTNTQAPLRGNGQKLI